MIAANPITDARESKSKVMLVKNRGRLISLLSDEILYIKAEGNTSLIKTSNGKRFLAVAKNIGLITRELENVFGHCFVRCHRSFLVNKDAVSAFCSKSRCLFVFDESIPVSRRNRHELFMQLAEMGIKNGDVQGGVLVLSGSSIVDL